MTKRYGFMLLAAGALGAAACSDDTGTMVTEPMPQTFDVTVENVSTVFDFPMSGSFTTPVGSDGPGPALPGGVFEIMFSAPPGSHLSFATMFAQSNDWFFGPDGNGIALWDANGAQVSGDVTDQVYLWDSGTEADAEPGLGPNQAPRESGPNVGADDPDPMLRLASDAWGTLPAVEDMIRVSLHPMGPTSFRLTIENLDDGTKLRATDGNTYPIPLSPGVWVVHTASDPLYTVGQPDRGEGLEGIAEDGAVGALAMSLAARTGLTSPITPGVWAVSDGSPVLFMAGMTQPGNGLESLAEEGSPTALGASLASGSNAAVTSSGLFTMPVGGSGAGPILPGQSYTFQVTGNPGDHLLFATMLAQTNDVFFAPAETGIDLFPGGNALDGDVSGMIFLWDAGTEVNQEPGIGLDQAPRQAAPDTGADENGVVRQVNDGYHYPDVGDMIRVRIRPAG